MKSFGLKHSASSSCILCSNKIFSVIPLHSNEAAHFYILNCVSWHVINNLRCKHVNTVCKCTFLAREPSGMHHARKRKTFKTFSAVATTIS